MLPRNYASQHCSVAATLEIVGDRWTLLLVREGLLGTRRFEDFQRELGVPRTVLSDRLRRLTEHGIVDRVRYQEHPERFEYRLTEKGSDLWPVLSELLSWGDRHVMGGRAPVIWRHRDCGGAMTDRRACERCATQLELGDIEPWPGPDAPARTRARLDRIRNVLANDTPGASAPDADLVPSATDPGETL